MTAECNACYRASTQPDWIADVVTRYRVDQPCQRHRPCERCSMSDDFCAEHKPETMTACCATSEPCDKHQDARHQDVPESTDGSER